MANITEQLLASMAEMHALQDTLTRVVAVQEGHSEALDNIWMLYSASLIFFMNPGFAFLEAGSVRFKNAQHVLAKNVIVPVLCFLVWYILGYGLAFGATAVEPGKFASGRYFAMEGFWKDKVRFRNWFFQGCFCETAATIVSGATAERTNFWAYCLYTVMMTGIIYPLVVYWVWSGSGWLCFTEDGTTKSLIGPCFMDFAGSGVIHLCGGVGALVGAATVGPRKDRFNPEKAADFEPHSINFIVLGTFILWFGWYGFNPGSTGAMHTSEKAYQSSIAAVNTSLSACSAGLMVFLVRFGLTKRLDVGALCNGILAGLVAVTASCAFVAPWEAIIIGFIGGIFYLVSSWFVPRMGIDDPVEAFSVHAANGFWGIIACGFFGKPSEGIGGNGLFYNGSQLGVQLVGAIFIILWSASLSALVFVPLRFAGLLRCSDVLQDKGLDVAQHSPTKSYSVDPATSS